MKQLIMCLMLLGVMTGCSLVDGQTNGNGNKPVTERQILIVDQWDRYPDDPLLIKDARIVGDSLTLLVSYSGGCKPHGFQLLGSNAIMKSQPPQMNIRVAHNSNDDMCEALITEDLTFSLHPLRQWATTGGIILRLRGWEGELLYAR